MPGGPGGDTMVALTWTGGFLEEVAVEQRAKELVGVPRASEAGGLPWRENGTAQNWSKKSCCPRDR